jgi:hypothetical protein
MVTIVTDLEDFFGLGLVGGVGVQMVDSCEHLASKKKGNL